MLRAAGCRRNPVLVGSRERPGPAHDVAGVVTSPLTGDWPDCQLLEVGYTLFKDTLLGVFAQNRCALAWVERRGAGQHEELIAAHCPRLTVHCSSATDDSQMTPEFLSQVDDAARLLREGNRITLGTSPLAELRLITRRVSWGAGALARGEALREALAEVAEAAFEALPDAEEAGRLGTIWREYILARRSQPLVAADLGLARTAFFEARHRAVETVALALWQAEQQARREEPAIRHNLPRAPYAHFIPRTDEAGRDYVERIIQALVTSRAWLVAVDGPGGVGKTTLAYEAARCAVERRLFDAVAWSSAKPTELAPGATLARPVPARADSLEAILNTISVVLGQRSVLALPTLDEKLSAVNRLLAATTTLLVLDNLESLPTSEQTRLFGWLRELPSPTRALLTSRERYAIGEVVIPIFGMNPDEALAFLRTEAQTRGLVVPPVEDLRRVVEATHGVPLVMQFVVGTMARYGFTVEQALGPAATPRAPHLHDYLFEAAYQRLAPAARDLLHALTLFPAPATPEAIAAAAGQGEVAATLGLGELFRSFFVNRTDDGCYHLVPLVHDFLDVREASSPDRAAFVTAARQRLARFYAAALGTERLISLRLRLAMPEHENILATLKWASGAGAWELLADLVEAVGDVFGILGFWQDRVTWGRQAMRACELLGDYPRAAWFAVKEVGWNLHRLGNPAGADLIRDYLEQARRHEGEAWRRVEGLALRNLGRLARDRGDFDAAEALLKESLAVWEHIEEEGCLAFTRASLGLLQIQQSDYAAAEANLRVALAARQAMGDTGKVAEGLAELGKALAAQGRLGEGLRLVEEARDLAWQLPAPSPVYAYILHLRAEIEADILGNPSRARELAAESRAIFEQLGAKYAVDKAERTLERLAE